MNDHPKGNRERLSHAEQQQNERVCEQFRAAWEAGQRPRIEDFLATVSTASAAARVGLLERLVPEITIVRSLQPGFAQLLEGLPIFPSRSWDVLLSYWPRAGRCRSNEMVGQTCG